MPERDHTMRAYTSPLKLSCGSYEMGAAAVSLPSDGELESVGRDISIVATDL